MLCIFKNEEDEIVVQGGSTSDGAKRRGKDSGMCTYYNMGMTLNFTSENPCDEDQTVKHSSKKGAGTEKSNEKKVSFGILNM